MQRAAAGRQRAERYDVAPVRAGRIRELGREDTKAEVVVGRELVERTGQRGLREGHLRRALALGHIAHRVGDVEQEQHAGAAAGTLPVAERLLDRAR